MKKLFILFAACLIELTSCEQLSVADSQLKGTWECQHNQGRQTLEFGTKDVKYRVYADFYNSSATYSGTYTIKDQIITLKFTSLKTSKSTKPKIEYAEPDKLPTEAELIGNSAIIYSGYTFTRK